MDFADDFVFDDPLTFGYFFEEGFAANIFMFGSHSWDFFLSPTLVWLNYLEMISPSSVCLNSSGIVRILLSCELSRIEFSVLVVFVFRLGSKLLCLFPYLFYFLVRFHFLWTRAVSFFHLIRFVGTWSFLRVPWCRIFYFFRFKLCIFIWFFTKSYGRLTGYIT